MSNIELLCDIGELNHLFHDSIDVENFMQQTVDMVARHMKLDVCSIYTNEEAFENSLAVPILRGLAMKVFAS